jgi:hypothetical protein
LAVVVLAVRELADHLLVVQIMEQMEVIHLLHQALELRKPLQVAVVVVLAMVRMDLLVALQAGVQVDLQLQAVLLPHQDKETMVEAVQVLLFHQEAIVLEVQAEAEQVQQAATLQPQIIPQMEQVAQV